MSEFRHSCALRLETTTNWTSFRCCGSSGGGGRGWRSEGRKVGSDRVTAGSLRWPPPPPPPGLTIYITGGTALGWGRGALISQWMIKRYYLHGFSVDCPEERAASASHEGSFHLLKGPRVHNDHEF